MCEMKSNFSKLLIILAIVAFPTLALAQPTATVGSATTQPGGSVTIPVSFENNGSVVGFDFEIAYSQTLISAVDLTDCTGNDMSPGGVTCSNPSPGIVKVVVGTFPAAAISSAQIGTIGFTIAGSAPFGTTPLTVQNVTFANSSATAETPDQEAGDNGVITIQAAPAPEIAVSPTSATITAENGSTNTATFTVTNSGNADDLLVTDVDFSGTDAAKFTATSNTCPSSGTGVAENGTCSIVVTFAPDAVATFNASLDITSNGGNESIALTGIGTAGPAGDITITPASTFDFGELLTGEEDATQVFTATNTGAAGSTVTIGSADLNTLTGSPFSITANTCTNGTELDKDESCAVTVKFEPTSDGEATRTLTVSGTDANSTSVTDSSAMEGTGVTKSIYTSDPAAGASDSEVVGPEGSNDFTITLGNDGNADYTYSAALTSTSASVFSVTAGASGTVAGGESATVTVNCTLEDTETYEGSVVITVGDDEYTYNYECVGLPPLPVPVDNKWALALLALMMLMAASFGFRFMARQ